MQTELQLKERHVEKRVGVINKSSIKHPLVSEAFVTVSYFRSSD